jgi:mono/diheme cytochrome c family protein
LIHINGEALTIAVFWPLSSPDRSGGIAPLILAVGEIDMRLLRLLALPSLVWIGAATAQGLPGDPEAGGKLAREVCAACHIVSKDQLHDPGVGAPTFFEVVAHPSVTALSLRVFLRTPHANMPDLMLTPDETDDIISYILTLRGD